MSETCEAYAVYENNGCIVRKCFNKMVQILLNYLNAQFSICIVRSPDAVLDGTIKIVMILLPNWIR